MPKYRRLVIKLSGQAIAGSAGFGFDKDRLNHLAREVIAARDTGVEVAVVVGGGNVFRGNRAEDWGIDRVEADNIGMLGTVIRTSASVRSGIWRRARSSCSAAATASRSRPPTTPLSSEPSNSTPTLCWSRRTAPTACTTRIPTRSPPPVASTT